MRRLPIDPEAGEEVRGDRRSLRRDDLRPCCIGKQIQAGVNPPLRAASALAPAISFGKESKSLRKPGGRDSSRLETSVRVFGVTGNRSSASTRRCKMRPHPPHPGGEGAPSRPPDSTADADASPDPMPTICGNACKCMPDYAQSSALVADTTSDRLRMLAGEHETTVQPAGNAMTPRLNPGLRDPATGSGASYVIRNVRDRRVAARRQSVPRLQRQPRRTELAHEQGQAECVGVLPYPKVRRNVLPNFKLAATHAEPGLQPLGGHSDRPRRPGS